MSQATALAAPNPTRTAMTVLFGVSAAHLLNDAMQNVVPAVFPMFQENLHLSFAQIGWIAFTLNITASILQPLIGYYTDRRPMPMLLPLGMVFTLLGMVGLALSPSLAYLLLSSALIGVGSSVLHPESSRVAHMAAGKGKGFAQSIFQVGGNTGQALAPLMVAYIISPIGQHGFLWFTLLAVIGIVIQAKIGQWYRAKTREKMRATARAADASASPSRFSKGFIAFVLSILVLMLFSKFVYLSSMSGYYSFYFMDKYNLPLEKAQLCLFALQFAGMAGTFIGGPLADKIGRQKVIWFSILGTAPFSLLLPYASPLGAVLLCLAIGLILMSGFSVIIVYAQELLPGHVGTIAGLFFGISFGLGGLGSVVMGSLIDAHGVDYMIKLSAFLPLLGLFALLLPKDSVIMGGRK
ncbi:major facilitator superfamily MFS_1 [Paenibacillus curdlanolyticus YK9]|uniref:Major facilitator superfamily MFS_1 n=1 Tax=Paenibacillus curdlanolyticus YK9 TaxID=717606 RepID=E0IG55_9BACL|nr:MFS transporter [Paenibacillus curdlanolyticus]EFM08635.1 major facilitator superfamily MFS_1 [Paenibacillus curdlanolyticus YK9]